MTCEVIVTTQQETLREKNISRAREALERARALRRARREFGVDGITRYIENVDGEWLEDWSDSNSMPLNPKASEFGSNRCV